jgi:hypothetical protein
MGRGRRLSGENEEARGGAMASATAPLLAQQGAPHEFGKSEKDRQKTGVGADACHGVAISLWQLDPVMLRE